MAFVIDTRLRGYTVHDFVEKCWLLRAKCGPCGYIGEIRNAELQALPQLAQIGQVVDRLKCTKCGGSEGYVDFLQDRSATMTKQMADLDRRRAGKPDE